MNWVSKILFDPFSLWKLFYTCERRLEHYSDMAKHALPDRRTDLWVDHTFEKRNIPRAGGSLIVLPGLFLVEHRDLPKKCIVSGPEDPRLLSEEFLQEATDCICNFLSIPHLKLNGENRFMIRAFLLFIRNPVLSEKAKAFVMHHEMAHLHFKHSEKPYLHLPNSLVLMGGFSLSVAAYLLTPLSSVLLALSVLVGTVALIKIGQCTWNSLKSRAQEGDADLWAAEKVPESLTGAIYMFNVLKEAGKVERKISWISHLLFSGSGDWRFLYPSHPSYTERVRYLTEFQNKLCKV